MRLAPGRSFCVAEGGFASQTGQAPSPTGCRRNSLRLYAWADRIPMPLAMPDIKQGRSPKTRYQGSKRAIAPLILNALRSIPYTTVLDAFGGTAAMAHAFKCAGKHVTYNDLLAFNHQIGLALVENDTLTLADDEVRPIGDAHPGRPYDDFIERTFDGVYFTRQENRWLDVASANVRAMACPYRRALAYDALFQSALAKRPYNLFHRGNLSMRLADVPRGFGNKTSWDRPFPDHLQRFASEANAAIIDGRGTCRAVCGDVLDVEGDFDLVYIDPPYLNRRGVGVDYHHFYHFLEGIMHYDHWADLVDLASKHRRLLPRRDRWTDPKAVRSAFADLLDRFRKSVLVVSYRSDGLVSPEELCSMVRKVKRQSEVLVVSRRQYVLSTNAATHEVLVIGR